MQEFDPHVLEEKPIPPPEVFSKKARVGSLDEYRELYAAAQADPEAFWGQQAKLLHWFEAPKKVLEWKPPHAKWFVGGKLNVSYNCLDRHLEKNANKPALMWEAEDGSTIQYTYAELHERVCQFANALLSLGVKPADCIAIYMPMVPELPIAMLGCARVGAVHSVVFGGFSATAIADRIADCKAKILITADGGFRRGKIVPLKETADAAMKNCPTIEKCIVVQRTKEAVAWQDGRDLWWHDLEEKAQKENIAAPFDSEHPLYILYTSGTTGATQRRPAHLRRLFAATYLEHSAGFRSARRRHLLVYRRYRMGYRPQLRGVRPAIQWRDHRDVRGRAGLPAARPLLGND